jgi:hypothetical protein
METAKKALEQMKKGTVKVLWGFVVARIGDRYIVGQTISIRSEGVTADEAAAILAAPRD